MTRKPHCPHKTPLPLFSSNPSPITHLIQRSWLSLPSNGAVVEGNEEEENKWILLRVFCLQGYDFRDRNKERLRGWNEWTLSLLLCGLCLGSLSGKKQRDGLRSLGEGSETGSQRWSCSIVMEETEQIPYVKRVPGTTWMPPTRHVLWGEGKPL